MSNRLVSYHHATLRKSMRQLFSVCVLVVASYSFAQTASQSPSQALESITNTQIQLAQSEIQRISGLVTAGVLPPARLEQAQEDLRDIQDNALLTRALYAGALIQNLDEQTAEDMLAAAERRVDRQQRRIEQQQKLVESGVVALSFLTPLQDELKKRQFDLDIAKQRVDLVREVANAARLEQSLEDAQNAEMPGALSAGMEHFDGAAPFVEARDLR